MIILQPSHVIFFSIIIFGVLNIIENLLHYNYGRNYAEDKFNLKMPSYSDWLKIVLTMIVFAFLQGYLTEYFSERY
jgi:hypothetical protein